MIASKVRTRVTFTNTLAGEEEVAGGESSVNR